jgi:hypothetical protein
MLETNVSLDVVEKSTLGVLDLFPIRNLFPQSLTPTPCLIALGTYYNLVHVAKTKPYALVFDAIWARAVAGECVIPFLYAAIRAIGSALGYEVHCLETDPVYCHCGYLFVKKAMPKILTPLDSEFLSLSKAYVKQVANEPSDDKKPSTNHLLSEIATQFTYEPSLPPFVVPSITIW